MLESPTEFILPTNPRDLIAGTIVDTPDSSVQALRFGASNQFLALGIFANQSDPPNGAGNSFDLCPGGIIARPKVRLGSYASRTDLKIKVLAQTSGPVLRHSVFATAAGRDLQPLLVDGTLKVAGFFKRSDANSDNRITVSDVVFILRQVYLGDTSTPRCSDAADANDDNVINMTDAIFVVRYIFQIGATPPPAPGAVACGVDPTPSGLPRDCLESCP